MAGLAVRVCLKTHDVTGSEGFLRCARHFFTGILTYFKEQWRGAPQKDPLPGCFRSWNNTPQIHAFSFAAPAGILAICIIRAI